MRIEPLRPEHFERLQDRGNPAPELTHIRDYLRDHPELRPMLEQWGRVCIWGDEVVACWGISERWESVVEAWGFFSESMPVLFVLRAIRENLREIEAKGVRRVQCSVREGNEYGLRWMRILGFEYEGSMQNYGLGGHENHYLYARIQ